MTIMPGYLDLPVARGHKIDIQGATPQSVSVTTYGNVTNAERAYRDALLAMGWVEISEHRLKKGEGPSARCISIYGWIMMRTYDPSRLRPHEISFSKDSCSLEFD
jgi:hypothetical protein